MRESFRPTTTRTLSSTDKPHLSLDFLLSLKELPSAHYKRKLQDPSDSVVYNLKTLKQELGCGYVLIATKRERVRVLVQDKVFPMRNDSCDDGDRLVSFSLSQNDD